MNSERRWIRASEIGEYLYCQRAWWYRLQGETSANVQELALGTRQHARHGRGLQWVTAQRALAILFIFVALGLLAMQALF
jgi:hypothetical protein